MFGNISTYSYGMHALIDYHGLYRRLANEWHATVSDAMLDVLIADLVRGPTIMLRHVPKHCGSEEETPVCIPNAMQRRYATPEVRHRALLRVPSGAVVAVTGPIHRVRSARFTTAKVAG
jgi:hypothetical protein